MFLTRWLGWIEEGLIMALLASMTLVTFAQVVARYVFNYSYVWAMELTGVMFAWLIFIGMVYGVRVGAHIGVDAFVKLLRPGAARVVAILAASLCVIYAVIVTIGGYIYVMKMYDVGILMQDLPIPQWIPRIIMPLGFALLAFRFAQVLFRLVSGQSVSLLGDEAEEALRMEGLDSPEPDGAGHRDDPASRRR